MATTVPHNKSRSKLTELKGPVVISHKSVSCGVNLVDLSWAPGESAVTRWVRWRLTTGGGSQLWPLSSPHSLLASSRWAPPVPWQWQSLGATGRVEVCESSGGQGLGLPPSLRITLLARASDQAAQDGGGGDGLQLLAGRAVKSHPKGVEIWGWE